MMGPLALWKFLTSPFGRGIAAFLVISTGLIWFGHNQYDEGYAAAEAKHVADMVVIEVALKSAADETRRQASELEAYREAARMLAMETDNEILADGNACVPTPDELRRAKRRWGSSD